MSASASGSMSVTMSASRVETATYTISPTRTITASDTGSGTMTLPHSDSMTITRTQSGSITVPKTDTPRPTLTTQVTAAIDNVTKPCGPGGTGRSQFYPKIRSDVQHDYISNQVQLPIETPKIHKSENSME
eukprot:gene2822-biopygen1367